MTLFFSRSWNFKKKYIQEKTRVGENGEKLKKKEEEGEHLHTSILLIMHTMH